MVTAAPLWRRFSSTRQVSGSPSPLGVLRMRQELNKKDLAHFFAQQAKRRITRSLEEQ
jgi:hypothetical protein